jgi:hypothetical protein
MFSLFAVFIRRDMRSSHPKMTKEPMMSIIVCEPTTVLP